MGTVRQQSIISVLFLMGSVLLGFFNKIPIGTKALTAAEIGAMGVLLATASLFGIFAQVGISSIVYRYFPFFKDEKGTKKGFLSFALIYPVFGLFIACMLIYLLQDFVIAQYDFDGADGGTSKRLVTDLYYLAIPLVVILVFFDVLAAYSSSLMKSAAPIFFRDVFTKVLITGLLLLCLYNYIDFFQFMVLLVGAYFCQLAGIAGYLYYHGQLSIGGKWDEEMMGKRGEMFQYGSFTMFSKGTNYLVSWIDGAMVSAILGMQSAGIYYIFQYFGLLTTLASRALQPITLPLVAGGFKEQDMERVEDVYKRTAMIQLIGGALILLGIFINLDNVVKLVPPEYAPGAMVGIIVGMARLFDMSTGVNGMIITNSKYYKLDLYFMLLLTGLTVLTNYYFIHKIGIVGAAIATALTAFIYNFGKWLFVKWKFNMQPFSWKTLWVLAIIIVTTIIGYYVPQMSNWYLDILVRSSIATVVYSALILGTNVSPDINAAIKMVIGKMGLIKS